MPRLTAIRKQALDGIMKEALFESTVAVLSGHGMDGLTMDRVASEAGIAKGSLYRYFRSKRELLEFVYTKMIDPIFQATDEIVAQQQSAIEKLKGHLNTLLDHVARYGQVHRLLFEDETTHSLLQSSERRTIEAACQQLAELFKQGIAEGVFRLADPLMLAIMYFGICKSVLQSRPDLETSEQRDDIRCLILGNFLNGIAAEEQQID